MKAKFRDAMLAPTEHAIRLGQGLVRLPPLIQPDHGTPGLCNPPAEAVIGALYLLTPPHGGDPMTFIWSGGVWLVGVNHRLNARRLAFEPDYLSRHGWRYAGEAKDGVSI